MTKNGYGLMDLAYLKGESTYSATTNTYPFNLAIDKPINDNLITSANRGISMLPNQRQAYFDTSTKPGIK